MVYKQSGRRDRAVFDSLISLFALQNQTQATERQIREAFEQMREFLGKEESTRLGALQQESEEKKELVKKKTDSISSCILTFSHAVIAIENEMASNDALFLKVGGFSIFFL